MKYLQQFKWNTKKASKAFMQDTYKRRRSAPSKYSITIKPAENSIDLSSSFQGNKPRFSEPKSALNEKQASMFNSYSMMRKSFNHPEQEDMDDFSEGTPHSKVRFDLNKTYDRPKNGFSKSFRQPKGILKLDKKES